MEFPDDLKYTREHEWVALAGDIATIGITDHAQHELGDVVFVELPAVGDRVEKGEAFGVVESTKAVSDVYSPVNGEVTEVNDDLPDNPEQLNEDPYGDGWIIKVRIASQVDLGDLMSAADYRAYIEEQAEGNG